MDRAIKPRKPKTYGKSLNPEKTVNITWTNRWKKKPEEMIKCVRKYESIVAMPKDDATLINLATELVEWSLKEDSLLIQDFPVMKKLNPYKFLKLAKADTHHYFSAAVEFATAILGSKLTKGALFKTMEPTTARALLPMYNKEYKLYLEEQRDKAIEKMNTNEAVRVIDTIYTTDKVRPFIIENRD